MKITLTFIESYTTGPLTFPAGHQLTCTFLGMHGDSYRVRWGDQVLHVGQPAVKVGWPNASI